MPVGPSCRVCVHCAMAVFEVGEWVWLPEPGVGVANTDVIAVPAQVQGQLISTGESGGRVRLESGEERELSAEQTKPLVACSAACAAPAVLDAHDLSALPQLSDRALLHALRARFSGIS